jgi:hypothetical protein
MKRPRNESLRKERNPQRLYLKGLGAFGDANGVNLRQRARSQKGQSNGDVEIG